MRPDFYDKVDEVLGFSKYRRSMMALKVLWWEIQAMVEGKR